MLGRPCVRFIHQQCVSCGHIESQEVYRRLVPREGNYAYDLIVEVGLARFRDHRQDAEIQSDCQRRWGVSLSPSSIGLLANSFLDGLAAVHQAHAPALRRRLADDGGYVMHVDGTCEPGTDVLFMAMAEPRGWTLEVAKMTTEHKEAISKLMRHGVDQFGLPLAVMRDLSTNIEQAKLDTIPEARDLICHYHFLENVGEQLCEKPHTELTAALRRLKIRPALRSIRGGLVRASRNGGRRLSKGEIQHLLTYPDDIAKLDATALRRFMAYLLLCWLDDYPADLKGEYFPFDLPSLAFYRRGKKLASLIGKLVDPQGCPQRELSTFRTIARHLTSLHEDQAVVAAAARLEKAAVLFEKFRKVLRLTSHPSERLLRGRVPSEERKVTELMPKRLETWRNGLQKRHDREVDVEKRADQATVLKYLRKYEQQLVGHVLQLEGDRGLLVACRTNNPAEHRFGATKQKLRRKVGAKKLARQLQAMRPEALLIWNLSDAEYVNLVLDGSLANLPAAVAKHWKSASAIRKERLTPTTDHPMPTTKQQLRNPQLLGNAAQIIRKLVDATQDKNNAA